MEEYNSFESEAAGSEEAAPSPENGEAAEHWSMIDQLGLLLGSAETAEMVALRTGSQAELRENFQIYNDRAREVVEQKTGEEYERAQLWLSTMMLFYSMISGKEENLAEDIQDLRDNLDFGIEVDDVAAKIIELICQVAEERLKMR